MCCLPWLIRTRFSPWNFFPYLQKQVFLDILVNFFVCSVNSFESPHRGDFNEYTYYTRTIIL